MFLPEDRSGMRVSFFACFIDLINPAVLEYRDRSHSNGN